MYLWGGLALVPSMWRSLRQSRPGSSERLARPDARWIVSSALLGCVAAPYAYVRGLAGTPAHVIGLLVNLEAVFGVLVAVLLFRDRLTRRRAWGVTLLIAGAIFTAALAGRRHDGGGSDVSVAAIGWIALACLFWAFDTNLLSPVARRDPSAVVVTHNLFGGAVALLLAALAGTWPSSLDARSLWMGAAVGVVGYGLSVYLLLRALARLGPARTTALFIVVSAVTGVIASAIVGGESIPAWIAGSMALIASGAWTISREESARPPDERAGPEAKP